MLMSFVTVALHGFLRAQEDMPPDFGAPSGGPGLVGALVGGVFALVWLVVALVMVVSMWKIFTKAGEPGWAAIVPIYNLIVLLKIVGRPVWWILIFFVCSPVAMIIISLDLAKVFGKSTGFAVGLILLGPIFLPMLAFGDARYTAPPPAA